MIKYNLLKIAPLTQNPGDCTGVLFGIRRKFINNQFTSLILCTINRYINGVFYLEQLKYPKKTWAEVASKNFPRDENKNCLNLQQFQALRLDDKLATGLFPQQPGFSDQCR